MKFFLIKWITVIVFFIATFWPEYGLMFQAIKYFPVNPVLVLAMVMIWAIPAALFLPLSRFYFQMFTTISFVGLFGTLTWMVYPNVDFILSNVYIYLIVLAAVIIGWWTVSTTVWRRMRNIVAVDEGDDPD